MTTDYRLVSSGLYVQASSGADRQLRERIAELEFANEDREWIALGASDQSFEFSREFVKTITRLARLYYIKNPLIGRGVNVKTDYVFGRGVSIGAKDETINEVVQAFLDDKQNKTELISHEARAAKDRELTIDGNIFFILVPHKETGHIRIYTIDVDEVTDIITDPANRKANWYYRRDWIEVETDLATGQSKETRQTAYYRDWRNRPNAERSSIGGNPVVADQFVYQVKVGGFSNWKFGISQLYSALDWSKAYKTFLENWSTIVAAYARFAFKVTTTGGKAGVTAAKNRLATTVSTSSGENNPAPITGSNIVMAQGNDIEPIRTAGAQTSAEDGRRLLLMVAATFGLPETFFGDVSVGTLATATSLDRPTELMLTSRQTLWTDILHDIIDFVIYHAVTAINGPLRSFGDVSMNEYGEPIVTFGDTTNEDGETVPINDHIDIDFPPIVERSLTDTMTAITQAAAFIPDNKILARLALIALGENDIDELIDQLYPEEETAPPEEYNQPPIDPATAELASAAQDFRAAVEALREAFEAGRTPPTPPNGSGRLRLVES